MKCSKCGWIVCAASLHWIPLNAGFGGVAGDLARSLFGQVGDLVGRTLIDPWARKEFPVCRPCAAWVPVVKSPVDAGTLREAFNRQMQGR